MAAILLSTLFAAAAVLALVAIAASWRQFGSAALALRDQLAACGQVRELRFTLVTIAVSGEVRQAGATVYRPRFRSAARGLPLQPVLRAAA